MWTSKPYQNMYSLAGYGLLAPPHPHNNHIQHKKKNLLLARFAFVGSISLQALQMKVNINRGLV